MKKNSTQNSKIIKASPEKLYEAFTSPDALSVWQAPGDMTAKVHHFDLRVGGGYEMSLFYSENDHDSKGKTKGKEDRFTARFIELTPFKKIVEAINFNSDDPAFQGEMIIEITLEANDNGTEVTMLFRDIPPGIKPEDNEAGTKSSLEKLARYVEE
ncbi:MAG: Activator of Hsp90 ATPase 1 family protein [Bacteroidetes bacterium]|jgi:uncharacterized protein YndB with AHSA1/START domain|nr:Activator of Hsp90 ATPase 1 family protein [Bacteroidota bacterium]